MNEEEALRYAANILRTMSAMQGHNDTYLEAARALDDYFKPPCPGLHAIDNYNQAWCGGTPVPASHLSD